MKPQRSIDAASHDLKTRVPGAPYVAARTGPPRLQQAVGNAHALQQALASVRRESAVARHEVKRLKEVNKRLRELALEREQELLNAWHCAHHDDLTGLPNRALLLDRLGQALAQAKRRRKQLALLFLDLDRFKDINDRLGHAAGDALLRRVAERLAASIRSGDTACRYGGDEFVVLLPEVEGERHALEVARKIRGRLAKPCLVDEHSISVTASVGVAVYPIHGLNQRELIERADLAMYLAKALLAGSAARVRKAAAR